jgi:hypothetical protein
MTSRRRARFRRPPGHAGQAVNVHRLPLDDCQSTAPDGVFPAATSPLAVTVMSWMAAPLLGNGNAVAFIRVHVRPSEDNQPAGTSAPFCVVIPPATNPTPGLNATVPTC